MFDPNSAMQGVDASNFGAENARLPWSCKLPLIVLYPSLMLWASVGIGFSNWGGGNLFIGFCIGFAMISLPVVLGIFSMGAFQDKNTKRGWILLLLHLLCWAGLYGIFVAWMHASRG